MVVPGFLTIEEQRALVYEYLSLPYGEKGPFLVQRGVTRKMLRRWHSQVFADTLEQGLVPRAGGRVSAEESGVVKRLLAENQALREEMALREAHHHRQLEATTEELDRQRRAVDALGKAIEILHPNGASKTSEAPDAADPASPASPCRSPSRSSRRSR